MKNIQSVYITAIDKFIKIKRILIASQTIIEN